MGKYNFALKYFPGKTKCFNSLSPGVLDPGIYQGGDPQLYFGFFGLFYDNP